MKKLIVLIALVTVTNLTTRCFAQDLGGAIHAGYLSEIETLGFGGSLLYDINDTWGLAAGGTFAFKSEDNIDVRWIAADLDVHYTFFDNLYALAGGQYLSARVKEDETFNGFVLNEGSAVTSSDFGVNVGAGYRYNLMDNVSVYSEVKYVALESGYIDARLGLHFAF
ncbi:MAG: hypothetical protein CMC70_04835 [Flavobacteriaceae bacterium]|nr:hypothetical protein [Flavobacteriaceae bacterium]